MPRTITAVRYSQREVIALLRSAVVDGQAAWGRRHGISKQYIRDALCGRTPPSDKMAKALGLRRSVIWERR